MTESKPGKSEKTGTILITGAGGYVGRQLARRLAASHRVLGIDLRSDPHAGFELEAMDIRDPALRELMRDKQVTHVVHLAAVLQDSGDRARDFDIDVNGTRNVLEACCAAGVQHLTVSSSGAAYGYHADNPEWLSETDALRGNPEFAYSDHKRQVEELLAEFRADHPELQQLVLRVGTVIGAQTNNLITRLFEQSRVIAIRGSASPFVFIWDQDLLGIIEHGVRQSVSGVFNVAGDGALPLREIAHLLGKPYVPVPAVVLQAALAVGHRLKLVGYGPEQLNFLRYRPVLDNRRLRESFGYRLQKTSREAFMEYALAHRAASTKVAGDSA